MIIRKRNIFKGDFPRKAEFIEGVYDSLERARELYPEFNLRNCEVPIVFFAKGTTAGYARWRKGVMGAITYNLEFNVEAIAKDWGDMYLDTIPHEVAHIVTRVLHGEKVASHGKEWTRIAKSLGCSGNRTHSLNLTPARIRKRKAKHLYKTDSGDELLLGPVQHKKMQAGKYRSFWVRSTGEHVYPHNWVMELS